MSASSRCALGPVRALLLWRLTHSRTSSLLRYVSSASQAATPANRAAARGGSEGNTVSSASLENPPVPASATPTAASNASSSRVGPEGTASTCAPPIGSASRGLPEGSAQATVENASTVASLKAAPGSVHKDESALRREASQRNGPPEVAKRAWSRTRRVFLYLLLLFGAKIALALSPLFESEASYDDGKEAVNGGGAQGAKSSSAPPAPPSPAPLLQASIPRWLSASRPFLYAQIFDRLVRDVVTAALIAREYASLPSDAPAPAWSLAHARGAARLLALCRVNGGVYVKLGQHIGSLEHLLPPEYPAGMKVLMRAAPADAWGDVRALLEEEFGDAAHPETWRPLAPPPPSAAAAAAISASSHSASASASAPLPPAPPSLAHMFSHLSERPLASASLAQVHEGTLSARLGGGRVAVKVQHRGLRETCAADVATIVAVVGAVKWAFPRFNYEWLADEVAANLPLELDFAHEAENCRTAGALFAHRADVAVPGVHAAATTHRVLTMSFEAGCYVNDVPALAAAGLRTADVARLLSEAFAEQIFVHGFCHADPHYANVLVRPLPAPGGGRPRPQLVLLDHGLYRRVPASLRLTYGRLWSAIIFGDEVGIKAHSAAMGIDDGELHKLWASMLTTLPWDRLMDAASTGSDKSRATLTPEQREETKAHARAYAGAITRILQLIPRELLLILKTNDCLRSIDTELGHPVNSYAIFAKYIQAALNAEEDRKHPHAWRLSRAIANAWAMAAVDMRLWQLGVYVWWHSPAENTNKKE